MAYYRDFERAADQDTSSRLSSGGLPMFVGVMMWLIVFGTGIGLLVTAKDKDDNDEKDRLNTAGGVLVGIAVLTFVIWIIYKYSRYTQGYAS